MQPRKSRLQLINPDGRECGFTLIELLMVIAIIGILAALTVALVGVASRNSKESRIKAELNRLVTAIEAYKADLGFYPPDNQLTPRDPRVNQLFYELVGTYQTGNAFVTANGKETITTMGASTYFGVQGFANSAPTAAKVKTFLQKLSAREYAEYSPPPNDVELLLVPAPGPNLVTGPSGVPLNTWRYVSSAPTNNPRSFDLWAEADLGGGAVRVIGNWKTKD
jgi:prepilin-type N-terminal cleavage/methylation domain-containing protein